MTRNVRNSVPPAEPPPPRPPRSAPARRSAPTAGPEDAGAYRDAERATVRRLLNCYLRETDHPDPRCTAETDGVPARFAVDLPSTGRTISGELRWFSPIGLHDYAEEMTAHRPGEPPAPAGPAAVIALLLAELGAASPAGSEPSSAGLAARITESIERTAGYLAAWRPAPEPADAQARSRRAEQSVLLGHPLHPTPKSAEGFTTADLPAYAPERGAAFRLHLLAIAPELLAERRIAGLARDALAGDGLPRCAVAAAEAAAPGLIGDESGFRLLPVHPWQLRYLSGQRRFQDLLGQGGLRPLGPIGPTVYATSSVRTVCLPGFGVGWKLPLHVRITNFVRTTPPEHLHRALDAAVVLARLGLTSRSSSFGVVGETAARWCVEPALAAELSVLYRDNPIDQHGPQVLAGLLDEAPCRTEPLLITEVRRALHCPAGPLPHGGVAEWLRRYLSLSLLPLLDVFHRHGVSLEAHVQNSLVCLDSGWPVRFLVRDLEGASLSTDHPLPGVPADSPARYPAAEAWRRLRYYAVTNHLGHLLHVLARHGNLPETSLWTVAAEVLRSAANPYAEELLTVPTLPAKANLLGAVTGRAERPAYPPIPNPLKEHR